MVFGGGAAPAIELIFVVVNTAGDERSRAAKRKLRLGRRNARNVFLKRIVSPQRLLNSNVHSIHCDAL